MICEAATELKTAKQKLSGDLSDVLNLRPMPTIALRISEICQDPQVKLNSVVELVACEPQIASRILSVVNSPVYGYSREIDSIPQAVVVLGFKRLLELAISIASKQVFDEGDGHTQIRTSLYEHCLATAAMGRILARNSEGSVEPGAAFLAGMLHDVGKLFLFDLAPTSYSELHCLIDARTRVEQESEYFGKNHAELGMHFAVTSGLPTSIHSAIADHHAFENNQQSLLAQNTDLANSLVKNWGLGNQVDIAVETSECNEAASHWLNTNSEEKVGQIKEDAFEQYEMLKSLFMN